MKREMRRQRRRREGGMKRRMEGGKENGEEDRNIWKKGRRKWEGETKSKYSEEEEVSQGNRTGNERNIKRKEEEEGGRGKQKHNKV